VGEWNDPWLDAAYHNVWQISWTDFGCRARG